MSPGSDSLSQATGEDLSRLKPSSIRRTIQSMSHEPTWWKKNLHPETTPSHSHFAAYLRREANKKNSLSGMEEGVYESHTAFMLCLLERRLFICEMCLHRLKNQEKQTSTERLVCKVQSPGAVVHLQPELHHVCCSSKNKNEARAAFDLHNKHEEIWHSETRAMWLEMLFAFRRS